MIIYHVYQGCIDDYISWKNHLYVYLGFIDYIACNQGCIDIIYHIYQGFIDD